MRVRGICTSTIVACLLLASSATVSAAQERTNLSTTPSKIASQKEATASILVSIFDGTRKPLPSDTQVLIRVLDGNHKEVVTGYHRGNSFRLVDLPVFDNFGDDYTVIVWAKGYKQAGYFPVHITPDRIVPVDLMLVPNNSDFDFSEAQWNLLKERNPQLWRILVGGADEETARARYERLMKDYPAAIACLLNITTSMADVQLPSGKTPLAYYKELVWDHTMEEDRFFGYVDPALVGEIREAAALGQFNKIAGIGLLHPGATNSWKQNRFGEANLHFTFHENDTKVIDGVTCVKLEIDIDYYRDVLAHTFLELIPNMVTGNLTDPKAVYQLKFIAARQNNDDFEPPYTLVACSKDKAQTQTKHKERRTLSFLRRKHAKH